MTIKLYEEEDKLDFLENHYRTSYDINSYSLEIITQQVEEKGLISTATLTFSTQEILEEAFDIFDKYQIQRIILHEFVEDNIFIDLSNINFPDSIKCIEIDFYTNRKCKINLLSKPSQILKNIRSFKLNGKYTYDFNQYSALPNIKQLCVTYQKKSLGWLEINGIIDLRIDQFKEENLQSLQKLRSLKRLSIFGGSIESLDGIENLKNLEALTIFNTNSLISLDALLKSTSIMSLEFDRYSNITDWSFLKEMTQLRWLRVGVADSLNFSLSNPNLIAKSAKTIDNNKETENQINKRYLGLSNEERDRIQFNFYNGTASVNYYE